MAEEENKERIASSTPDVEDVELPSLLEKTKEVTGDMVDTGKSPRHDKETHGTSDDIDADTPVDDVKGPSVFERVKEEIEAFAEAVHPKK